MSAVPKKKRRGRPRGSKNKPKVVVPPEIKETLQPHQQDIVAVPAPTQESSFVAGYFGLDKIEGEAINKMLADKIFEERRAACIQENLNPYKVEELAGPTINPHAGSEFADLGIPCEPSSGWDAINLASTEAEELKSILRQIDAKVKDLASYPMDHGLRCGMNEVEILLVSNREKFSK